MLLSLNKQLLFINENFMTVNWQAADGIVALGTVGENISH